MKWGVKLGPPYPLSKQAQGINFLIKDLNKFSYKEFEKLMSPNEVRETKSGSCHDQVLYEYTELKKLGLNPKCKFFIESDNQGQGGTTHSLVFFNLNNKTFWLENAWDDEKGLRSYKNEQAMVKDVVRRWNKKPQFPILYEGDLNLAKMRKGMTLQDIVNIVDFKD